MSNTCFLDCVIDYENTEDAINLYDVLITEFRINNENREGTFIGSNECLFCGGEITRYNNTVYICGWTTWCPEHEDMKNILNWMLKEGTITNLSMRYECHEELQYGEYIYNGKVLKDTWLREEDFSEDTDENPEYYQQKEELFQQKKQVKIIPFP